MQRYHHSSYAEGNSVLDKEDQFRAANQSCDETYTPFIQCSAPSSNPDPAARQVNLRQQEKHRQTGPLHIVEVVGCLEPSPSSTWTLTHVGEPVTSTTQATSLTAL